jgi:hypothetical protein
MTQPFGRVASVLISAAGTGYCTIVCPNGVEWEVTTVSVSTNVANPVGTVQPLVTIFDDSSPNPGKFIAGSYSGNRDSAIAKHAMGGGQPITAQWTGAVAGAIATFRIGGTQRQVGR